MSSSDYIPSYPPDKHQSSHNRKNTAWSQ